MTGVIKTYDGRRFALPVLLEWKLQYACGTPCDSFEVRCPWGAGLEKALSDGVSFEGFEGEEQVFAGVVDEYECRWGEEGGRLFLAGRGMGALLLDNEAAPADYQTATLDDILRDHVFPYGILLSQRGQVPPVPGFSVESGSSEWQVLRDFAKYHGGIEPRFDRAGRLVLTDWESEKRLVIDDNTPLVQLCYRERRYGVLSEVLVLDRARKTSQRTVNQALLDRGYRCRRVICTPGKSSYREMRQSGEFQLAQSAEGRLTLEVTLPKVFAAWPGELVEVRRTRPAVDGVWRVQESECGMNARGAYTRLVLGNSESER